MMFQYIEFSVKVLIYKDGKYIGKKYITQGWIGGALKTLIMNPHTSRS